MTFHAKLDVWRGCDLSIIFHIICQVGCFITMIGHDHIHFEYLRHIYCSTTYKYTVSQASALQLQHFIASAYSDPPSCELVLGIVCDSLDIISYFRDKTIEVGCTSQ